MTPDLSVIIPIYNRGDVIRYTLESLQRASTGLTVETIIVDDGSTPPTADTLARLRFSPDKLIRQENRGLLYARLTGLAAATGRYVLFLDSDDLVTADKFTAQIAAMDRTSAEVSYTDTAHTVLAGDFADLTITPDDALIATYEIAQFFITVQPAPHSPMFRRAFLEEIVRTAIFPPSPLYNSVAEIWFYHIAATHPGRVVYVPGPRAIVGAHPDTRLTNHWERLGIASLAVMEAFARGCPPTSPAANYARRLVGEKAFLAWRRLPRDFHPAFARRLLNLWRTLCHDAFSPALGGPSFQTLARLVGPIRAARAFRCVQAVPYASCRTLPDTDFARLLAAIPPP